MATYFDPTDADDLALLHASVRSHAELENVAATVEAEIIETYRFPVLGPYFTWTPYRIDSTISTLSPYYDATESFVVWLAGFRPDPDDTLTSPLLREALRRTIANVVSHRLRNYYSQDNVIQEQRGRRGVRYSISHNSKWPEDWDALLGAYDLRPRYNI